MNEDQFKFISSIVVVVILVLWWFISSMFDAVEIGQWGLNHDKFNKKIKKDKIYEPGLYLIGITHDFLKFPNTYKTIEFSRDTGKDALRVKTTDGVTMLIEFSFQYKLMKDNLFDLYDDFKLAYENQILLRAKEGILFSGQDYAAHEYFENRTSIGHSISVEVGKNIAKVFAELKDFQLRRVDVADPAFETAIEEVEVANQKARISSFKQEADVIRAETAELVSKKTALVELIGAEAKADAYELQTEAEAEATGLRNTAYVYSRNYTITELGFNTTELLAYQYIQMLEEHSEHRLLISSDTPSLLTG